MILIDKRYAHVHVTFFTAREQIFKGFLVKNTLKCNCHIKIFIMIFFYLHNLYLFDVVKMVYFLGYPTNINETTWLYPPGCFSVAKGYLASLKLGGLGCIDAPWEHSKSIEHKPQRKKERKKERNEKGRRTLHWISMGYGCTSLYLTDSP